MDTNDQAAHAAEGEENFADMFEKSFKKQERLSPGQMIESMIVKISGEWIFLDLGGKGEGYLDRKELVDAEGKLTVKEGDTVRVYFVNTSNNEMHFTTKIGSGPGKQSQFEDAWKNGLPVDGHVVKEMKGGFEVKIGGTARAFCPFSQMGVRRDEKQADYVGKTLPFKIIEFAENGRNIVLSRRPLLDEEKKVKKAGLERDAAGGRQAPRHRDLHPELRRIRRHRRPGRAAADLRDRLDQDREGQRHPVRGPAGGRDRQEDRLGKGPVLLQPEGRAARSLGAGGEHLPDRLLPHRDGLPPCHLRRLCDAGRRPGRADPYLEAGRRGKRIAHPREVVKEGQVIEVRIEAVDRANRKLSLSLASISRAEQEEADTVKDYKKQNVDAPQNMGSLGDMLKAKMDQKEK